MAYAIKMKRYIVFLDENGDAITTPRAVKSEYEVDAELEGVTDANYLVGTKEELLRLGCGLSEEDFKE